MPRVVALVADRVLRARLAHALDGSALVLVDTAEALWRAIRVQAALLVFLEATADTTHLLAALRAEHPGLATVAYCSFGRGAASTLLDLARAGVHDILIAGLDDDRVSIQAAIAHALRRSTADDVAGRVQDLHLPAPAARILRFYCNAAARPVGVTEAARLLGVDRRTLYGRLANAGLPGPQTVAAYARLLVAARLLDAGGSSVEQVAHALSYPSANALRNALRRYVDASAQDLRALGGYAYLLEHFARVLEASILTRLAPGGTTHQPNPLS